ncbi:MerR family DNA-binding transcriptional regulator [Clostridium neuense]|uniref:MerR family DNA-binding transcriptional regulator n=1 Tax=Clostridium neuense TaxID=1728934 RepID=UPI003878225E
MYKIGEFSKIAGLTVKILRYYDEENYRRKNEKGKGAYKKNRPLHKSRKERGKLYELQS